MECTASTTTATVCVTNPLATLDPAPTTIPENDTRGGGGGGQGSVVIGAVAGTLAGVLVILIAVAIVCLTVIISVNKRRRRTAREDAARESKGGLANTAYTTTTLDQAAKTDNKFANPTYSPSATDQAIKTDDGFTNPTYTPTVIGHAVKNDNWFTDPTYSTTAVGHIAPGLQQYHAHNDPRGKIDKDPTQYTVLGGLAPTTAALIVNQPPDYEDVDTIDPSPYSIPVPTVSDRQPPVTQAEDSYQLAPQALDYEIPQPASNVGPPPFSSTIRDEETREEPRETGGNVYYLS